MRRVTRSSIAGLLACSEPPAAEPAFPRASAPVEPQDHGGAIDRGAPVDRGKAFAAAAAERVGERAAMVHDQLEGRDITDRRVLAAMLTVPRHVFVPEPSRALAYDDGPLPLGYEATISQPYIVALMSELADVQPGDRVLDVGTGSGYQAAILAELGAQVFAIEIVSDLAASARRRLATLGYAIDVERGDGWKGRPEHAPYDAIVVAAAPPEIPPALVDQLADGGKLVVPIGDRGAQRLQVITRRGDRTETRTVTAVAFVPLVRGE